MILCLVGTNPYDFTRLVKAVDQLASKIDMPVKVQLGNTKYKPQYAEYFTFKAKSEVEQLLKEADLVISQGGYGSMTDAILLRKKIIAIPRQPKFSESQDNQEELVRYYESKGYIRACYEIEDLEKIVFQVLEEDIENFNEYEMETNIKVSKLIKDYINEL